MKPLIISVLLFLSVSVLAQPGLSPATAEAVIRAALQAETLMWTPFPLPYEVDRAQSSTDSVLLESLYKHGLVTRESELRLAGEAVNGRSRKVAQALWVYRYPDGRAGDTAEGFYYGRPELLRVVELSAPYLVGDYYYAEAYIQWAAVDLQTWIQDPALRTARTLRRSLESRVKPFERRVYLQFDGQQWGFWRGQPGQL